MKRIQTAQWADQCLLRQSRTPRPRPSTNRLASLPPRHDRQTRPQSTLSTSSSPTASDSFPQTPTFSASSSSWGSSLPSTIHNNTSSLPTASSLPPSPPTSAKLAALHARLSLPSQFPLATLSIALRDASAYPSPQPNNASLALLGNTIMSYHLSEYLISHYPRLPMAVTFAAMTAFIGPPTLTQLVREWGVEPASSPGPEVDPGLLQLLRLPPNHALPSSSSTFSPSNRRRYPRGLSSRIVYSDDFGDFPASSKDTSQTHPGTTLAAASSAFAHALHGALYLHCGRRASKTFFTSHILSRHLSLSSLFDFRQPTRDLSRLCAREGFEAPVARIISETGRRSRHPVFVVGVYSGEDKLGEGSGASLDEARTRAAVNGLKGWYLYSPLGGRVPSDAEDDEGRKTWQSIMVDGGEIVV